MFQLRWPTGIRRVGLTIRPEKWLGLKSSRRTWTVLALALFMVFAIGVSALQNPGQGEQTGARNAKVKPKRAPAGRDRNTRTGGPPDLPPDRLRPLDRRIRWEPSMRWRTCASQVCGRCSLAADRFAGYQRFKAGSQRVALWLVTSSGSDNRHSCSVWSTCNQIPSASDDVAGSQP